MRKVLALLLGVILISACSPKENNIIAKFDDTKITVQEFKKAFEKNYDDTLRARETSLKERKKFLDMYVNFRMKLRDAWVRGYWDDPETMNDINKYKTKVGVSYIKEKKLIAPGIRKLYNQRKWEYRLSHIMFKIFNDYKKKYNLAQSLIQKLKQGASFDSLCKKYSDDGYSKDIGGDIYWFTPGMVSYQFDDAMTRTPVGQVYSKPVRSPYGLHILKVTDKRKRVPAVHVRQILIMYKLPNGKVDSARALRLIKQIKAELDKGKDFGELAKRFSDDPISSMRNGDMGFLRRRRTAKSFDEAAFNLKKPGDISPIVQTNLGYHLIQLVEKKPYPKFEDVRSKLRNIYIQQRYQRDVKHYSDSLKTLYHYAENPNVFKIVRNNKTVANFNRKIWKTPLAKALKDSFLFAIDGKKFTVDSLFNYAIQDKQMMSRRVNPKNFREAVDRYATEKLMEREVKDLEKYDDGFKKLLADYRNGILIFKIQQDEVWDKMNLDTSAVMKYFNANREKYSFPDRVEFYEIFTRKDSLAKKYYNQLKNGADFKKLARKVTERRSHKKNGGYFGLQPVSSSVMAQQAWKLSKAGDVSKPFKAGNGWSIVMLVKKVPRRLKTFAEASSQVFSDYQDMLTQKLENDYVNRLRKRYSPEINYDLLKKLF